MAKSYNHKNIIKYYLIIFFIMNLLGFSIDLLLYFNNTIYPFEIKKTASPNKDMIKNFDVLKNTKKDIGAGGVICLCPDVYHLTEKDKVIPISCIF